MAIVLVSYLSFRYIEQQTSWLEIFESSEYTVFVHPLKPAATSTQLVMSNSSIEVSEQGIGISFQLEDRISDAFDPSVFRVMSAADSWKPAILHSQFMREPFSTANLLRRDANNGADIVIGGHILTESDGHKITINIFERNDPEKLCANLESPICVFDRKVISIENENFDVVSDYITSQLCRLIKENGKTDKKACETSQKTFPVDPLIAQKNEHGRDNKIYTKLFSGRAKLQRRGAALSEAIRDFEAVIDAAPENSDAWGLYAQSLEPIDTFIVNADNANRTKAEFRGKERLAASVAYSLDPASSMALGAMGNVYRNAGQWNEAQEFYDRAVRNNAPLEVKEDSVEFLIWTCQHESALRIANEIAAQDRFSDLFLTWQGQSLLYNGKGRRASQILKTVLKRNRSYHPARFFLALNSVNENDYGEAETVIAGFPEVGPFNRNKFIEILHWAVEGRDAGSIPNPGASRFAQIFLVAVDPKLGAKTVFQKMRLSEPPYDILGFLGFANADDIRRSPYYFEQLRRTGLLDFWRDNQLSTPCHPIE